MRGLHSVGLGCLRSTSSSSSRASGSSNLVLPLSFLRQTPLQCSYRSVNMNRSVRTRMDQEVREATQQRTEYDFDREKWMKNMRIATMDCIVDPTITPLRYNSFQGIKRWINRFVTMRKLQDRRPDFDPKQLEQLFVSLKKISKARHLDQTSKSLLQLLTTQAEADRIIKDIRSRMNDDFSNQSWKALRQRDSNPDVYGISINSFELLHTYMGQMTKEDWLQLTYRCEFREREAMVADNLHAAEWSVQLEYPVFEVRLTDGMGEATRSPFKVVGIIKKDGTRYGKDVQDAASLRKQFDKASKWF